MFQKLFGTKRSDLKSPRFNWSLWYYGRCRLGKYKVFKTKIAGLGRSQISKLKLILRTNPRIYYEKFN